MSMKLLVVLCLMAAVAAGPAPAPTLLRGHRGPGAVVEQVLGGRGRGHGGLVNIGGGVLGNKLGFLFRTLTGHRHLARTHLNDILELKVQSFNDVCVLLSRVVVSLCDTIEASIRGLGNLLSRVFFSYLRLIVCFWGGAGSDNPICRGDINVLIGVQGDARDAYGVISLYGLGDSSARLGRIISLFTRGRGIKRCRGSLRVVLSLALDLVDRLQIVINRSGRLTKADFTFCFRKITLLLGVVGNSRQRGLGLQIVKSFVPMCNQFIVEAGYPDFGDWSPLEIDINFGNDDRAPWALPAIDGNTEVTLSLGGLIGNVFRGLLGVTRLASNLIKDILGFAINTIDDVFTLVLKITLGLGGVLDATIAGLGSLLVRLVAGLLKIVLCFVGRGKYGVCGSVWDRQVGVTEDATSIDLVIRLYGLEGSRLQVEDFINTYTNNKGIESTSGSIKILLQTSLTLSRMIESRKWDRSLVVIVFQHVTYMLGAVANSNSKGVGTSLCNKFIPVFNKYLVAEGFTGYGDKLSDMIRVVELANNDNHIWSADIDDDDDKRTGFIILPRRSGVVVRGGSGGPIGGIFRSVFGTIRGVSRLAVRALDTIVNIKIEALRDVFSLIVNLSFVLQVTLNNLVAGLGSLFARLIAVIIKIGVCIKGYPGDRSICTREWNSRFGVNGDATNEADLIVLFRLGKAQDELNGYITRHTRGKGIKTTRRTIRLILEKIRTLIVFITNYKRYSRQTLTDSFLILTSVSASVGNTRQRDAGRQIIRELIPRCGKYFKQEGYPDITVQVTVIDKETADSNDDKVDWDSNDTTTPSSGGPTTPSSSDDSNNPSSGGPTTPSSSDSGTTPSGGGSTPSSSDDSTTPSSGGPTTPSSSDSRTTPSSGGPTTPSSSDSSTTPSSGGPSTPSSSDSSTTPSSGGPTTPSSSDSSTTPSSGGPTTPSSSDSSTTPSSGGPTTPSSSDSSTTPSSGGPTTPSSSDSSTTPSSSGGPTTPSSSDESTSPSSSDVSTTPSSDGNTGSGNDSGKDISVSIQVIPGVTRLSSTIITELTKIKITTFVDVIRLTTKLTLALGGIIDSIVSGLGSIIIRLVAVVYKIGYCVNGWGSDRSICTKEWNAQWAVVGEATTAKDLIALYRVHNCKSDVAALISSFTNGKGIDSTKGITKLLLQKALDLSVIVSSGTITKQHFSSVFVTVFSMFGAITNSYKQGSGTVVIRKVIPAVSVYFVRQGFPDVRVQVDTVVSVARVGDSDKFDWTVIKSGGDTNSDKLATNVKQAFKDVKGQGGDKVSLTAALNLSPPRSFEDALSFGVQVVQALGGVLDAFIARLGTLIVRIVGCLLNYIVAILGASRNAKSFVAQKAFYSSFGVQVQGSAWTDLVAGFGLTKVKADLDVILNQYTDNKGRSSLGVVDKVFFDSAYSLADVVVLGQGIKEEHLAVVYRAVTTMLGAFANSLQAGLGEKIVDNMLPTCSYYLEQNGYPSLVPQSKQIYATIGACSGKPAPWARSARVVTREG